MGQATLWVVIAVIIVVVIGGLLVFRSTTPTEEVAPAPTDAEFVDETPVKEPGQFIQQAPDASVPSSTEGTDTDVKEVTASPAAESGEAVTISVDESGFSPATVTVSVGTTVTFLNNGQGAHWPASDVHPTHQALPGFDAKVGLATGEGYSFTFTKEGTWSFHDHLAPSQVGTVVVQ